MGKIISKMAVSIFLAVFVISSFTGVIYGKDSDVEESKIILDVSGQKTEDINIAFLKDGFTIETEFEYYGESNDSVYKIPLWTFDDRESNVLEFYVTKYSDVYMEAEVIYEEKISLDSCYLGEIETGNHKLVANVYESGERVYFDVYLDGLKVISTTQLGIDWCKLNTFYSNNYSFKDGLFKNDNSVVKVKRNKIYEGVFKPEIFTEKDVFKVVDKLPNEFYVQAEDYAELGALLIKSGDRYTITFNNKNSEEFYGEFVFKVIGTIGYENDFYPWKNIVFNAYRDGAYEWGDLLKLSDESEIKCTLIGAENMDDIRKLYDAGVECVVTIERKGDDFTYKAEIDDYTMILEVISGYKLPEKCYILLGLYSCEMTDIKTNLTKIKSGLCKADDTKWYYYINDRVDTSYTGMAKNEYGWWYIKNGKLDKSYTGMAKNEYGWWYMKNGKLDKSYTGMAKNEYGWWYMKNGKLDKSYTGMAKNEYGWFYMKNGKLDQSYTGMAKNEYGWWYIKNGKLDKSYTGMTKNQYGWFYMKNGKLDSSYTGLGKNAYGTWYITNGKLDTKFCGKVKIGGKSYTIKNGKVM